MNVSNINYMTQYEKVITSVQQVTGFINTY